MITEVQAVNMLQDQIEAERLCHNRLLEIAKSEHVTPEERREMYVQAAEEVDHERAFQKLLDRYDWRNMPRVWEGVTKYIARTAGPADDPAERLADFRSMERMMATSLLSARRMFEEIGDAEAVAVYTQVAIDEKHHKGVTEPLLRKFMQIPGGLGDKIKARYRRNLGWARDAFIQYKAAQSASVR